MDFLWFKPPNELKKVAKAKAGIAMILISDEYAKKILTHQHQDKGESK